MVGRAYLRGLPCALRLWPVALLLFLANLAAGLCVGALGWHWLDVAFDGSAATQTLLTHLELDVVVDLVVHHGESLRILLATAAVVALAFVAVGAWGDSAVAVSVTEETGLTESLRRTPSLLPAYLGLAGLTLVLQGASVAAGLVLSRSAVRWTAGSSAAMTYYAAVASGVVVAAALVFGLTTVHDHARIRLAADGSGAIGAFIWSLRFVGRHVAATLSLALLLLVTGVIVWGAYQVFAGWIPVTSRAGLLLSLVWGEALLFVRMLVRVWGFAATRDLQRRMPY